MKFITLTHKNYNDIIYRALKYCYEQKEFCKIITRGGFIRDTEHYMPQWFEQFEKEYTLKILFNHVLTINGRYVGIITGFKDEISYNTSLITIYDIAEFSGNLSRKSARNLARHAGSKYTIGFNEILEEVKDEYYRLKKYEKDFQFDEN